MGNLKYQITNTQSFNDPVYKISKMVSSLTTRFYLFPFFIFSLPVFSFLLAQETIFNCKSLVIDLFSRCPWKLSDLIRFACVKFFPFYECFLFSRWGEDWKLKILSDNSIRSNPTINCIWWGWFKVIRTCDYITVNLVINFSAFQLN